MLVINNHLDLMYVCIKGKYLRKKLKLNLENKSRYIDVNLKEKIN